MAMRWRSSRPRRTTGGEICSILLLAGTLASSCSAQYYPPSSSSSSTSSASILEDSLGVYRYVGGLGRVYLRCRDSSLDPVTNCRITLRAASARVLPYSFLARSRFRDDYYLSGLGSYRTVGYRRRGASSSLSRYGYSSSLYRGRYGDGSCPVGDNGYYGYDRRRFRYLRGGRDVIAVRGRSARVDDDNGNDKQEEEVEGRGEEEEEEEIRVLALVVGEDRHDQVQGRRSGDDDDKESHAIKFPRRRDMTPKRKKRRMGRYRRHYPTRYDDYGGVGGSGSYYGSYYGGGGGGGGYYDGRPPYFDGIYGGGIGGGGGLYPYPEECREVGRECEYEGELSCDIERSVVGGGVGGGGGFRTSSSSASSSLLSSGVRVRWLRLEEDPLLSSRTGARFRDAIDYLGGRARLSSTGNTLRISRLRPEDKGIYVCEIVDSRSPIRSSSLLLSSAAGRRVLAKEVRFFPTYPCD